ncbi:DUF3046 domain-containing protein [Georgenia faecalis]|uniref:DUF3046 domain-containing protein n=1 Tax=Georgenia faecalis TaxID=2483799 RepID=A0ABV9DC45_9MICO|nr:DUF3046 domain-containing protein [Georgenia faecalis]
MKHSEFWQVVDETFGPAYGRSLAEDLVLPGLSGRSAARAVREGEDPQRVWDAMCTEMELSEAARWRHRGQVDRTPRR